MRPNADMASARPKIDWTQRIARHLLPDGSVIVPPRIAAWLEDKAGMLPERRIMLRGTDPEAYEVLAALHLSALSRGGTGEAIIRSANGTRMVKSPNDIQQSEEWLTTAEAAEMTGVTDRCIRKWIATQRLPARRHGGRWLVNRQHLNITPQAHAA
jgi:excisionase family DNA binding protein